MFKTINILITALTLFSCSLAAADKRPNIVFVLCDDLGYSDIGFNQSEESNIKDIVSPNIDKLAHDGTIFTSAYSVHPFCGPSRAGIMTGRYPHEIGSQFNLAFFTEYGIDKEETYFSEVLQDAGYYTGIMGKWHLGEVEGYRPTERGFDEFYGFLGGGHLYWSNRLKTVEQSEHIMATYPHDITKNGSYDSYKLAMVRDTTFVPLSDEKDYMTDMLTDEGIAFVDRAQQEDKPFFLFMSYNAPHTPLVAKDEDIAALEAAPFNLKFRTKKRATYSAMIYALDKQVEVLVDALKERGVYDNTMIVFMSDNGGKGPDDIQGRQNSPLRGRKGDVYEGGNRVPMFIHWPASYKKPPKEYHNVVSGLDLYPTFVKLAKAKLPKDEILRGKDIVPYVLNNTDARGDEPFFALRVNSPNNWVSARKGPWKALSVKSGEWQLYNIEDDMSEDNPIDSEPAILDELIKEAAYWTQSHIDPVWFDSPNTYNFEDQWNKAGMPAWERTFPSYEFEK